MTLLVPSLTQRGVFIEWQKEEVGKPYKVDGGRCNPDNPDHDCSGLPSAAMQVAKAAPPGFCLDTDGWASYLIAHNCVVPLAIVRITPGMLAIRRKGHPAFDDNGHMVTSLGIINGVARTVEAHSTASGIVIGYFDGNHGFEIGGRPPNVDGFQSSAPTQSINEGVGMGWMIAAHPSGDGSYWNCDAAGHVYTYPPAGKGNARYHGGGDWSPGAGKPKVKIGATVIAFKPTPTGNGYWMCDRFGHVFSFGDAGFFGGQDSSGVKLNGPCTDFVPTHSGRGYWLISSVGSIYAFGDAHRLGDPNGNPRT